MTVAVFSGGFGYTSPPAVTFSGGGAPLQQATGIAIISGGAVTGVTVVTDGAGYTAPRQSASAAAAASAPRQPPA